MKQSDLTKPQAKQLLYRNNAGSFGKTTWKSIRILLKKGQTKKA